MKVSRESVGMKSAITSKASVLALVALLAGCAATASPPQQPAASSAAPVSAADADAFVAAAEKELFDFSIFNAQVQWINNTYITDDTDAVAARVGAQGTEMSVRLAKEAAKFDNVQGLSSDTRRKLGILKQGIVLPAPSTPGAATELNTIATRLQSTYGKGKGTLDGKPMSGNDLEEKMGTVRDPARLKEMWASWHKVGVPMRADYVRMVQIANEGAHELGFADTGAMWRAGYDMPADQFAALTDKLWEQVKPLYVQLHCYTRAKLNEKYGDAVQPATGPIRADLLGNMWAQEWGNIYDVVAPKGAGNVGYDTTDLLVAKK
jgi:peptidyl-dipeptidase A